MTTTNEPIRVLRRTRQTRDMTGEPISDDELDQILEAARWTGSSTNRQPWRFVVVRDPEHLRQIGEVQPGERKPGIGHVAGAGAAIAIVMTADKPTWETYDEARVAERILVAATALGLAAAIGWVRDYQQEEVRAILGLPEDRALRTIVSVGHATAAGARPKSAPGEARLPLDELVHHERWGGQDGS
jgi:nitroreductase